MTNRYFSILTSSQAIYDGHCVLQNSGTLYNGNLVMISGGTAGTSGSLVVSTGSAVGMAFDMLAMTELPTTAELVANLGGKRCNYAFGQFEALVGPDLFTGAALPTPGTVLYDYGDGTIDASARGRAITTSIGKCLQNDIQVQSADGAYSVARCRFDFTRILG